MNKLLGSAAAMILVLGTTGALAQVNQHQQNQTKRINQGVNSGELTHREADNLRDDQAEIRRTEARMRARNGGQLTVADRARLNVMQAEANAKIYKKKHNNRDRN
ncbi:MAG: hypothetical protein FD163_2167 [Hyphomonadaceae bacterium]|nr:MAG: hypothetical protein FD128_2353 [Hyphomonadaceae bacterium]KAF0183447.1 MAG: hypothetical protein FD163_2167 [Hyphomonadaceae bacterium]